MNNKKQVNFSNESLWIHYSGSIVDELPKREWEYNKYIRSDIHDSLVAENDSLRAEVERLRKLDSEYGRVESIIIMLDPNFDGDSDHENCEDRLIASIKSMQARAKKAEAERDKLAAQYTTACRTIDKLATERDVAIKAMTEAATARGQAEGKLAASELPGIIDGWKARAEKAEAERDTALAQMAAAFEAAADAVNLLAGDDHTIRWAMDEIRALTPTDASAALSRMLDEAYAAGQVRMRDAAIERCVNILTETGIAGEIPDDPLSSLVRDDIRALPINPDAQKALDKMLAKAREDAIREAAAMCVPRKAKMKWGNRFTPTTKNPQSAAAQEARKQCHDAILALLTEKKQ